MTYKVDGIIIKRNNVNEADRILTILTKEHGKIKIIAKGIRRTKSKLAGSLELFYYSKLILAEGRNLDIVTSAQIEESFQNIRKDLKKTQTAFYFAEIIEKNIGEDQSNAEIFELFLSCLRALEKENNSIILPYFEINFLADTGFLPELHNCIDCGEKITPQNNSFNFTSGGIECGACGKGEKISDETIKLLRLFLSHKLETLLKIKYTQKMQTELSKIIRYYFKNTHQENLNSERFVR